MRTFAIGDRVMYSAKFLRSAGLFTGPTGFARGKVIGTASLRGGGQLVTVAWDDRAVADGMPAAGHVLSANLAPAGRPEVD